VQGCFQVIEKCKELPAGLQKASGRICQQNREARISDYNYAIAAKCSPWAAGKEIGVAKLRI
jgi:hypothetical protein